MSTFGVGGLFNFLAAVTGLFALFALARGLSVAAPRLNRRPFVMIQTIFAHDLAHAPDEGRTGA